jgi:hypothetical protein
VAEQNAFAEGEQHRRILQSHHAALVQERGAEQEVAIAGHEGQAALRRRLLEDGRHLGLEGAVAGVVADPGLEQVAEDEHGVGGCLAQVPGERVRGARMTGLQVQVGDEIDAAPAGRRGELVQGGQRRAGSLGDRARHDGASCAWLRRGRLNR